MLVQRTTVNQHRQHMHQHAHWHKLIYLTTEWTHVTIKKLVTLYTKPKQPVRNESFFHFHRPHTMLIYTACRVSLHIVCQWPCVDVVTLKQMPYAKWCILSLLWATKMVRSLFHVQTFVISSVLLHVLVIFKPWVGEFSNSCWEPWSLWQTHYIQAACTPCKQ